MKKITENVRFSVDGLLIKHVDFIRALNVIGRCYDGAIHGVEPVYAAIIGDSGTGKSRALEHYEDKYPPSRTCEKLVVPIVKIKVPSKPTVKGLATEILYQLGDPLYYKDTETVKTIRIRKLLRSTETRVIMLDEFQHFVDQGTNKVQHHVADWLKNLIDDMKISLVVAGLPRCLDVLWVNEQLARRFMVPIRLKRFDWRVDKERDEFIKILSALRENIDVFEFPDIESEEIAFRIYCATGGLIGFVIKIFKEVVAIGIDKKRHEFVMKDLSRAYKSVIIETGENLKNPFGRNFAATKDNKFIEQVLNRGKRADSLSRKTRGTRGIGVSAILSARQGGEK